MLVRATNRQKTRQTRPIVAATLNPCERPREIDLRAKDDQKKVFPILCNFGRGTCIHSIFFSTVVSRELGREKEEFGHGCKIVTGSSFSSSSFTSILIRGQTHEGECIFLLYGGGGGEALSGKLSKRYDIGQTKVFHFNIQYRKYLFD